MITFSASRPLKRAPTHPGELMREQLEEHLGLTVADAASRLGISRQSLHAALSGRSAVTAEMALRFSQLTKGAPELLLRMQVAHDLWHARQRIGAKLERIKAAA